MGFPTMRRMAALLVVAGSGVIAGCSPVVPASVGVMAAADVESALAAISWTGCDTVARAALPSGKTNVEICASPGAHTYGPRNAPSGSGAPVARMKNIGGLVEARWGLRPNNTYSIWLHSGVGGTHYTIIGSGVNTTGTYHGCNHAPANVSRAKFGTCADNPWPPVAGARSRGPSSSGEDDKGEHTLLDPATGPAWISCTEGCCTTSPRLTD